MEMFFEILDLIAILNIHIANLIKIRKNAYGWFFSMISIVWFLARAYNLGLISQSFGHLLSLATAIYGFYSWSKNDQAN